jgi:hypothetical protein
MITLSGLNLWAILVATVLGFVLGGLWYSPVAFGRAWLSAIGKSEAELGSPARAMLVTLLSSFVTSVLLAGLLRGLSVHTGSGGLWFGLLIGGGFIGTALASDFAFCRWSMKLLFIMAGYRIVYSGLAGGLLGMWQ